MLDKLIALLHIRGIQRKYVFFRVNCCLAGVKAFEKKRRLLNLLDGFEIGEGTKIVGPIESTAKLTVGKNCWIGKNFIINGNGTVTIGDNCDIAPEVIFQTGGHETGDRNRRAGAELVFQQTVGNGCWIGGRTTVLNNTTIGDSCIVAGCACVTKDVPANTLVGGVPARKLRDLNDEHT